jgi:hypothetical protein
MKFHQAVLLREDVVVEAAIRVTSVERTLVDIAAFLDTRQLERAVVAADRAGRLRWPRLVELLERSNGRLGVARLRRVVAGTDPRAVEARSPLEVDFLALCRKAGLPLPAVNVLVDGRLVDFVWVKERVIVETDGYAYHRDRPAFERDHEATIALTSAGYVVHRATYRMLKRDPGQFMTLVRSALDSAHHV